eukprot:COSAG01_NODE_937_length_12628_cov_12.665257_2_plen_153_part_00
MPVVRRHKPRISRAQKRFAFLLAQGGVPYPEIRERIRDWFGQQSPILSANTLMRIKTIGALTGDPAYSPPRVVLDRSLTYAHKILILDALKDRCTVSTRELERKLQVAEQSARTRFAHSTIDDAIREAMYTSKRVCPYNIRRCSRRGHFARV